MKKRKRQNKIRSILRASQTNPDGFANFTNIGITREEINIVCTYIESQNATTLRALNLRGNMGIEEHIFIALTSSQYCKLQSLYLGYTGLGSMNSIRALGEYLTSPSSSDLTLLYLSGNEGIGDKEGEQICISLTSSPYCRLQSLDLSSTGIGSNSIRALGMYLISPSASHLSKLYLIDNNKIGDNEVKLICSALSQNSTLKSLSLTGCGFGDRGILRLQYLLSNVNSSIKNIKSKHLQYTDEYFPQRISEIKEKYNDYKRMCNYINDIQSTYSLQLSSSSSQSGEEKEYLSNKDRLEILQFLHPIFKPLPPWRSINNRDQVLHFNCKRKSNVVDEDDCDQLIHSMIISLNKRKNSDIVINTQLDIFKWRILFICSIINSFT